MILTFWNFTTIVIFLLFLNSLYCTYHESTSVEQGQCLGQYLILEDLPKSTFCTKFIRCSKSERCSCCEVNHLLGLREDKGTYSLSVASPLLSVSASMSHNEIDAWLVDEGCWDWEGSKVYNMEGRMSSEFARAEEPGDWQLSDVQDRVYNIVWLATEKAFVVGTRNLHDLQKQRGTWQLHTGRIVKVQAQIERFSFQL